MFGFNRNLQVGLGGDNTSYASPVRDTTHRRATAPCFGISEQRRIVGQLIGLSAAETLGSWPIKDFLLCTRRFVANEFVLLEERRNVHAAFTVRRTILHTDDGALSP